MISKYLHWYRGILGAGCFSVLLFSALAAGKHSDLVEVTSVNPNIVISLPYATKNNFCNQVLYPVERCFLRRSVVDRLDRVQKDLEKEGYGLKIWDGYRPHSVQYKMWSIKPGTNYVANPRRGSRHNRGAAVDLTLINFKTGKELKMPTAYDVFSFRAHANYPRLPKQILRNRKRLQDAMVKHGFRIMQSEWWHFDAQGWTQYPLMNRQLDDLAREADAAKAIIKPKAVPNPTPGKADPLTKKTDPAKPAPEAKASPKPTTEKADPPTKESDEAKPVPEATSIPNPAPEKPAE